ncbi:MAG: flagellar biosynthesis regulator FlaF [Beijerinckiaceae bacterium]|jgi:flagellar protein FlaF|nr:flagellar biosynthesis regulator FlaF [Beijerinckiaceae bacterium]
MSYAANAYAKTAQAAPTSPRDLEAHVLIKSAARLQAIKDHWDEKKDDLDAALVTNRKIWTILVAAVSSEESQLPLDIKRNIVGLGMFIFNHTIALTAQHEIDPAKLQVLININREIALGLRARVEGPAAPDAA